MPSDLRVLKMFPTQATTIIEVHLRNSVCDAPEPWICPMHLLVYEDTRVDRHVDILVELSSR